MAVVSGCGTDQVPLSSPTPANPAQEQRCRDLLDALPETVADQPRRSVDPADALGAAWGDPAITLTCGDRMPTEFDRFSACQVVDKVGWFVPDEQLYDDDRDAELATVGRRPVIRVHLPATYRPDGLAAVMVDLAPAVEQQTRLVRQCR